MLLRFVVRNFLSIAEELELNLFPYTRIQNMKDHIYETPEVDLLKCAAIYGANGSGKSNLVKAAALLKAFVTNSEKHLDRIRLEGFRLDRTLHAEPSVFEIEFVTNGHYFLYTASLRVNQVVAEALYQTYPNKGTETLLFERTEEGARLGDQYLQTAEQQTRATIYTEELLKPNESLLSLLAVAEGYSAIKEAIAWIQTSLIIINPNDFLHKRLSFAMGHDEIAQFSNKLIKMLDTGISSMFLEKKSYHTLFGLDEPAREQAIRSRIATQKDNFTFTQLNGQDVIVQLEDGQLETYRLAAQHQDIDGEKVTFYPEEESDGTKRVLDFLVLWHSLLKENITVIIDEIGRSLHPNLLEQLVRFFMTSKSKGQLIFTTHEANLLQQDLFRRDEVWLMEKTNKGSSKITPLSDFKIRNYLDVRKGYLNGRFGGVPNLRHLFPEDFATHE